MPWFVSQRELDRLDGLIADYKAQRDQAVERLERIEKIARYEVAVFQNAFLRARNAVPRENAAPEELKPPPKPEAPPAIQPADPGEWQALIADQLEADPDMSLNQAEAAVRAILETEGKMAPA